MKPKPFESLNHFTRPCAMRATSLRGLRPLVCSRRRGGVILQHWRTNKNAARTGSRAACVSVYDITEPSNGPGLNQNRCKLYMKPGAWSTEFDRPRDWPRAVFGAEPAGDSDGEAAGGAPQRRRRESHLSTGA